VAVRTIVCISALGSVWPVRARGSVRRVPAVRGSVRQCAAGCGSVWQCAAVCGSSVAVCSSVRQQCGSLRFTLTAEAERCGRCPRRLS
jgi:hypothetical protein